MAELTAPTVVVKGDIGDDEVAYAQAKVQQAFERLSSPVLDAEIKLTHAPDPARERPWFAEATIDVNGVPVRGHVAGNDMREAIDLLEERLRHQVEHLIDRSRHPRRTPRHAERAPDRWRHGDRPADRPAHYDRPTEERELVRRKSFAAGDLTPDEAADAMELLGHAFFLFHNALSDADALLWLDDDGELVFVDATGRAEAAEGTVTAMRRGVLGVDQLTVDQALERLGIGLEPFVFFLDDDSGRGTVAYVRYDGHYGLVTLT